MGLPLCSDDATQGLPHGLPLCFYGLRLLTAFASSARSLS